MSWLQRFLKKSEVVTTTYFCHRRYRLVHYLEGKRLGLTNGEWFWVYDNAEHAHAEPYYSQEAAIWGFGEWM